MKLLVIGSGGREHALASKLAQTPKVQKVYVAPGNGGSATESGLENVDITDIPDLLALPKKEHLYLTAGGPEAPLPAAILHAFTAPGRQIVCPTPAARPLESSKDF